jgi:hypothetical protein
MQTRSHCSVRQKHVELEARRFGLWLAPRNVVSMDAPTFIPRGIDTESWLGFEQRIQQRRFNGLIDTARQALAAGDRQGALSAIAEARELNPGADELTTLEVQAAARADSRRGYYLSRLVATMLVGAVVLLAFSMLRGPVQAPAAPATTPRERPAPPIASAPATGAADTPLPAAPAAPPDIEPTPPTQQAPQVRRDAPRARVVPLTDEGRVAFALKRYGRTFTGSNFADCAITMRQLAATAVCRTAGERIWDVEMSLQDDGWMIDSAVARGK